MGYTEIDGLKIHYRTAGSLKRTKGQKVIYVHGVGCNSRVWEKHMDSIASSHTSAAIDLPGHGLSEGTGFRSAAEYGYCVSKLAESLGWDDFVVAGHSMGGVVALATILYHGGMVGAAIFVCTGSRLRVDPDILKISQECIRKGEPFHLDSSWGYSDSTSRSIIEGNDALTADTDPLVTYKDWVCCDSADFSTRLKDILIPALAICGEEDKLTPVKYHRFFQEKMPHCRLKVIEKAGHWVKAEQPQHFNAGIKEFLDGLPEV